MWKWEGRKEGKGVNRRRGRGEAQHYRDITNFLLDFIMTHIKMTKKHNTKEKFTLVKGLVPGVTEAGEL